MIVSKGFEVRYHMHVRRIRYQRQPGDISTNTAATEVALICEKVIQRIFNFAEVGSTYACGRVDDDDEVARHAVADFLMHTDSCTEGSYA